jgi:asparaginyl-tRNA synthetase
MSVAFRRHSRKRAANSAVVVRSLIFIAPDRQARARFHVRHCRTNSDLRREIKRSKTEGSLHAKGSEIQWGGDFGGTDETLLSQDFDRPLMLDGYPSAVKAFYIEPDSARPEVALGVDVLAPEGYGEIIGGGQRIHDADLLLRRIAEQNLPPEAFDWYIDLRKYGSVPHGGFGMGVERRVAWLCGLAHIRETIAFPRMLYRLKP